MARNYTLALSKGELLLFGDRQQNNITIAHATACPRRTRSEVGHPDEEEVYIWTRCPLLLGRPGATRCVRLWSFCSRNVFVSFQHYCFCSILFPSTELVFILHYVYLAVRFISTAEANSYPRRSVLCGCSFLRDRFEETH